MIWLAIVLVRKQQTKEIEERRTRNDIWRLRRRLHPKSLPVDQAADTTKRPISELSARIDVRGNPRTALNNRKVPFVDVETMGSGRENLDSAKVKVCWAVDKADEFSPKRFKTAPNEIQLNLFNLIRFKLQHWLARHFNRRPTVQLRHWAVHPARPVPISTVISLAIRASA